MKSRLDSIPTDHLLLMARKWIFVIGNVSNNSVSYLIKILVNATLRGDDECEWLLYKLVDIPEFGFAYQSKLNWIHEIMSHDDDPRAKYYYDITDPYDHMMYENIVSQAIFNAASHDNGFIAKARYVLYAGIRYKYSFDYDILVSYFIGREIEGYEEFWDNGIPSTQSTLLHPYQPLL